MKSIFTAMLAAALALPAWGDTIVLRDGTRYKGALQGATSSRITFRDSEGIVHRYSVSEVASIRFGEDSYDEQRFGNRPYDQNGRGNYVRPSSPDDSRGIPPDYERVVLPVGTEIAVRVNQSIDSRDATEGQTFYAEIAEDVRDEDGYLAIPRHAPATLIIRRLEGSGNRTSEMVLDLDSVTVQGHRYAVSTYDVEERNRQGIGANKRTGEFVGGGAVLGTIIGAIAGGGKGAAIGAAAGAVVGGTTQVLTRGKEIRVPAESVIRFRLDQRLRLHLIAD